MVWVIGCNGMLGTELCRKLSEKKIDFVGTGSDVDITDASSLDAFCKSNGAKFDFIVNCAAYTAVDKAESEFEIACRVNCDGVRNIARLAEKIGAKLVHVSTDYVFDGTGGADKLNPRPYREDDPIAPLGAYGKSKAEGEKAVLENCAESYILRTAWLYGWSGKNFVYTMIRAMNSRDSVKVVNDQTGTPTFCGTLSDIIIRIIGLFGTEKAVPYGIYHVTDEGETTWFDFTKEIKKQGIRLGLIGNPSCVVNPCTTEEYPTPAKRPVYSVLSKDKIQLALGIKIPEWQESLCVFLESEFFDKSRVK